MSIQKIGEDDIEQFTLTTNPRRSYMSSSLNGVTGSVNLFARRSDIEKEVQPLSAFTDSMHNDQDLQILLLCAQRTHRSQSMLTGVSDISKHMELYMSGVNAQAISARKQKQLDIIRFEPSFKFTSDTQRKNVILNTLFQYYRMASPSMHWAYTNYHCLNFFSNVDHLTASGVPSDSVILYPNSASAESDSAVSGSYVLREGFSFEFYINPRYTTFGPVSTPGSGSVFHAGTILHLSSTFAVSLVSGSSRDETDRPDAFRLILQLSHSADIPPSEINPNDLSVVPSSGSTAPRDLIFVMEDNKLRKNHWHHCSVRWGTRDTNNGTGSFVVDGVKRGEFIIPSATIAPAPFVGQGNPDVLCVGNFYEGSNAGINAQCLFFNQNIAGREGLLQLCDDGDGSTNTPEQFRFDHPLNAELHEIKIFNRYRNDNEIFDSMARGHIEEDGRIFYVPPFFTKEAPNLSPFGSDANATQIGGVLQTPFFGISGSTEDPFNVALSFGVGGRLINLENFVRDFETGQYPRLLHLSMSQIGGTTQEAMSANDFLYATGSVRKRNATVLPCDNGLFLPEFGLLASGALRASVLSDTETDRFKNDLGNLDLSIIRLRDMISTGALFDGLIFESGAFFEGLAGASPEDPGVDPGSVLTVFQRTRDNTSNEVVFFDISNMFYGRRILPGTFQIVDAALTGTAGKVSMVLRDDGHGNIYRAQAKTPHATWASVGNIFYNEGLVVIESPNVPHFGRDQYEIDFAGEQNIHMMRIHVLARAGEINSSSNPTADAEDVYYDASVGHDVGHRWRIKGHTSASTNSMVSASFDANETSDSFVFLTGLNFHDENLNVIMKSKFAQPIMKRNADRILFRIKMDF